MATPEQTPKTANIGMIGLAVMGENLALNIERNGYTVAVYNRPPSKDEPDRVTTFMSENEGGKFVGTHTPEEFVDSLERPRKIILLVKAGDPVDWTIDQLKPYLEAGDIIIDGGNSYFKDTERREKQLKAEGFNFVGSGVSGGEKGALWGPSLMPGGDREAYEHIRPIWEAIAAKVDGGPCVTYIGPGGAGHFVKMVHNGIEYGDMQLIAEAYDILRRVLGMTRRRDGRRLRRVEPRRPRIASSSRSPPRFSASKTRRRASRWSTWSSTRPGRRARASGRAQSRSTSASRSRPSTRRSTRATSPRARTSASRPSKQIGGPQRRRLGRRPRRDDSGRPRRALRVEDLLLRAGHEPDPRRLGELELGHRPRRDGAHLEGRLHHPRAVPRQDQARLPAARRPAEPAARPGLQRLHAEARRRTGGAPSRRGSRGRHRRPGMSRASLAYFDTYRTANLPLNLTQAQRDFFGAHTYQRNDRPDAGFVHTEWEELLEKQSK